MLQLQGFPGLTNCTARLFLLGSAALAATVALSETRPGFYEGLPTTLAAGVYSVEYYNNTTLVAVGQYLWDGSKEVGVYEVNTVLNGLDSRATSARLTNLDTVARDSTAANYRATGFSTPANVAAVTTAVNAARDAVIDRGNTAWVTGAPVDLTPLQNAVAAVLVQATQARKAVSNNVSVNLTTGVITIFEDNGTTPFIQFQGLNANDQPSATAAVKRVRIP